MSYVWYYISNPWEEMIFLGYYGFPNGTVVKNLPGDSRDMGSVPGSRRSTGVGNGNSLQYSCLEHSMEEPANL